MTFLFTAKFAMSLSLRMESFRSHMQPAAKSHVRMIMPRGGLQLARDERWVRYCSTLFYFPRGVLLED